MFSMFFAMCSTFHSTMQVNACAAENYFRWNYRDKGSTVALNPKWLGMNHLKWGGLFYENEEDEVDATWKSLKVEWQLTAFFQWVMLRRGHGGHYKAPRKEKRRKRKAKKLSWQASSWKGLSALDITWFSKAIDWPFDRLTVWPFDRLTIISDASQ